MPSLLLRRVFSVFIFHSRPLHQLSLKWVKWDIFHSLNTHMHIHIHAQHKTTQPLHIHKYSEIRHLGQLAGKMFCFYCFLLLLHDVVILLLLLLLLSMLKAWRIFSFMHLFMILSIATNLFLCFILCAQISIFGVSRQFPVFRMFLNTLSMNISVFCNVCHFA